MYQSSSCTELTSEDCVRSLLPSSWKEALSLSRVCTSDMLNVNCIHKMQLHWGPLLQAFIQKLVAALSTHSFFKHSIVHKEHFSRSYQAFGHLEIEEQICKVRFFKHMYVILNRPHVCSLIPLYAHHNLKASLKLRIILTYVSLNLVHTTILRYKNQNGR